MSTIIPEEFYEKNLAQNKYFLRKINKKSGWIAFLRLFSFALFIVFIIQIIKSPGILNIAASLSSLLLFIALINYSRNLNLSKKKTKELIKINELELIALGGDFSSFEDGNEFLNSEHEFTYDLDVFGRNSIFQFINRTCTSVGKKKLADLLLNAPLPDSQIKESQELFRELAQKPEFIQDFLSTGNMTEDNENDRYELVEWAKDRDYQISVFTKILTFIFPVLNVVILISGIIESVWFNAFYFTIPAIWLIYGFHVQRINKYHNQISRKQKILSKYLDLGNIIMDQDFRQKRLINIQKTIENSANAVKKLDSLIDLLDARLNMLMGAILNSLFMSDFHIIRKLEKWKLDNKNILTEFLNAPAEIDSSISLAVYSFNNPGFAFPEFTGSGFSAVELGHPLIQSEKRVNNDFHIRPSDKVFIITGANMAGKSTFLRILGVNMILAGTGAPVCAARMSFSPLKVFTGMRTTDNLAESESYFFAELKRLQKIIQKNKNGEKLLILLDEILKGTNSTDKHKG